MFLISYVVPNVPRSSAIFCLGADTWPQMPQFPSGSGRHCLTALLRTATINIPAAPCSTAMCSYVVYIIACVCVFAVIQMYVVMCVCMCIVLVVYGLVVSLFDVFMMCCHYMQHSNIRALLRPIHKLSIGNIRALTQSGS